MLNVDVKEQTFSDKEKLADETKLIALRIPEALRQKLRRTAFEQEISFSAAIRYILDDWYREHNE